MKYLDFYGFDSDERLFGGDIKLGEVCRRLASDQDLVGLLNSKIDAIDSGKIGIDEFNTIIIENLGKDKDVDLILRALKFLRSVNGHLGFLKNIISNGIFEDDMKTIRRLNVDQAIEIVAECFMKEEKVVGLLIEDVRRMFQKMMSAGIEDVVYARYRDS